MDRAGALSSATSYRFPAGFLWGAATSSHQVEGHNVANDWWELEQTGLLPYRSGEACRHWDLYENDFDLAHGLGHNAHRFSVEWSRIEPDEGRWSDEAVAHYRKVVTALRGRGLEPIVTLHHFTNPAWFARRGGWLRRDSVELFARYVERIVPALEGVRYWLTLNEPTVWAKHAYVVGDWPPCRRGRWDLAALVLWNQARAHIEASQIIHTRWPGARVGLAHSVTWIQPCDPDRRRDRLAARTHDFLLNEAFLHLMGARPRRRTGTAGRLDFLGINYYTRSIVRWDARGRALILGKECLDGHHTDRGPISDIGWEMYPRGLVSVVERFSRWNTPLMITENGIATTDEALRTTFLRAHLNSLGEAIRRGAPVIGYLHWSLMDNFEWSLGMKPHFGLCAVDGRTQVRTPRPAASLYADVCRSNEVAVP